MTNPFRVPAELSRRRLWTAYGVAIAADGLQLLLGPLGWAFFDEAIDAATMIALSFLVGFHPLFLPTFVVEFVPVVDMLPTWTGCLALVSSLRKRQMTAPGPRPPGPPPQPSTKAGNEVIDV